MTSCFIYRTYNLNFFRGANPKTGYPDDWKKGSGVGLYTFGLKMPYEEWVPLFTSPESDQLHDGAGIYSAIVGPEVTGSEFTSKYRAVTVAHCHKNLKQARAFNDRLIAADSPPFDQIKDILTTPSPSSSRSCPTLSTRSTSTPSSFPTRSSTRKGLITCVRLGVDSSVVCT